MCTTLVAIQVAGRAQLSTAVAGSLGMARTKSFARNAAERRSSGEGKGKPAPKGKFYAVRAGRTTGVFEEYPRSAVHGYSGSEFKVFPSRAAADAYCAEGGVGAAPAGESAAAPAVAPAAPAEPISFALPAAKGKGGKKRKARSGIASAELANSFTPKLRGSGDGAAERAAERAARGSDGDADAAGAGAGAGEGEGEGAGSPDGGRRGAWSPPRVVERSPGGSLLDERDLHDDDDNSEDSHDEQDEDEEDSDDDDDIDDDWSSAKMRQIARDSGLGDSSSDDDDNNGGGGATAAAEEDLSSEGEEVAFGNSEHDDDDEDEEGGGGIELSVSREILPPRRPGNPFGPARGAVGPSPQGPHSAGSAGVREGGGAPLPQELSLEQSDDDEGMSAVAAAVAAGQQEEEGGEE